MNESESTIANTANMLNVVQFSSIQRMAEDKPHFGSKPKILFVDDEERILNSLRALFRRQYDVTVTTDGYHALELLRFEHFHLLVSDQRMPNLLGVDLLQRARNVSPNTVRILLTGFADLAAIVGSVNEGEVYRYINKPWNNEELQEIIGDAVRVGEELSGLASETAGRVVPLKLRPAQPDTRVAEFAGAAVEAVPTAVMGTSLLFLDQKQQLIKTFRDCGLSGRIALSAATPVEALQLMQEHAVGVIVASIEGVDKDNVGFMCLLKREHPHVVLLAVARLGDSETTVELVNAARVFRVIFHPLRPKVLRHHLEAAMKQVDQLKVQPMLLKAQQAEETALTRSLLAGIGQLLRSRLDSVRSFFGLRPA